MMQDVYTKILLQTENMVINNPLNLGIAKYIGPKEYHVVLKPGWWKVGKSSPSTDLVEGPRHDRIVGLKSFDLQ